MVPEHVVIPSATGKGKFALFSYWYCHRAKLGLSLQYEFNTFHCTHYPVLYINKDMNVF